MVKDINARGGATSLCREGPKIQAVWVAQVADVKRAARIRCNGAATANVPASTEDKPLSAIISRYADDLTSLLTTSLVPVVTLVT